MYMEFKEKTTEKKFGLSLIDEDGFVSQLFYTRDVWENIIKTIEKEISEYDISRIFN